MVKADIAALGITLAGELAEEAEEEEAAPGQFEVLPENWEAVQVFERCSRQWRYKGLDEVIGLDLTPVISVLSLYELTPAEGLERLDQVQLIERGALSVMKQPRN
ncbi:MULTISPECIES: DUF1799 domain-containing protein [unclassified Halomonas]|uniref:DUF1799 domain-containing protein n=1 Tax=unclassified Halomonas TaxID=2609666 RepID=UPI0009905043|nr:MULTISPECIES: DUF1799 domain-containing protein [unclassified Halomonas]AQU83252.1 hypothetical protein B2G49_12155 [Halomonas sp. 'Soap Lake \